MKYVERLREWADLLDKTVPANLDMELWFIEKPCGTYACAAGYACLHPAFIDSGLTLNVAGPVYKQYRYYEAIAHFFGITREDTETICHPDNYDVDMTAHEQRDEVVKRIRRVADSLAARVENETAP